MDEDQVRAIVRDEIVKLISPVIAEAATALSEMAFDVDTLPGSLITNIANAAGGLLGGL